MEMVRRQYQVSTVKQSVRSEYPYPKSSYDVLKRTGGGLKYVLTEHEGSIEDMDINGDGSEAVTGKYCKTEYSV